MVENILRGLWEIMSTNPLVGLEAQAKKSFNRKRSMIRKREKVIRQLLPSETS